jgi:hypothetical protein
VSFFQFCFILENRAIFLQFIGQKYPTISYVLPFIYECQNKLTVFIGKHLDLEMENACRAGM